ncbi:MAG: Calx-beta domain-containing protein [Ferrimonas sp.]
MKNSIYCGALLLTLSGCNGTDSSDNQDINTLVSSQVQAADGLCRNGGQWLQMGLDSNNNGVLDSYEISDQQLICNGQDGLVGASALFTVTEAELPEQCANGGQQLSSGLDLNRNGLLDDDEIQSHFYLCHGSAGFNGLSGTNSVVRTSQVESSAQCLNGGIVIETGLDQNDNLILDDDEVSQTQSVCNGVDGAAGSTGADGTDGFNVLINLTEEPIGAQCSNGGQRLDVGTDNNRNDALDEDEISQTRYLCNGEDLAAPLELLVSGESVEEGQDFVPFTVQLSAPQNEAITITYGTIDITATAGSDYVATTGSVTFAPGETVKSIPVALLADQAYECTEAFLLTLNHQGRSYSGFGQVIDDGQVLPMATLSMQADEMRENGGQTHGVVEFEQPLCRDVNLSISYSGTAEHGSDFSAPDTLMVAANSSASAFAIDVIDDDISEAREQIAIHLSSAETQFSNNSDQLDILPVNAQLIAGNYGTCIISADGAVRCSGYNSDHNFALSTSSDIGDEFGEASRFYQCNENGLDGLLSINYLQPDNGQYCDSNGGIEIFSGLDSNKNQQLDSSEASRSVVRCHGDDDQYLTQGPTEYTLPQVCANGGQVVYIGRDDNSDGQLTTSWMGDKLQSSQLGSVSVQTLGLGEYHTCALFTDQQVKCWGRNDSGELGLGLPAEEPYDTIGDEQSERQDGLIAINFGAERHAVSLSVGNEHSCAILDNGALTCWGVGDHGRLANGSTDAIGNDPMIAINGLPTIDFGLDSSDQPLTTKTVSAGHAHTCAILSDNKVRCWGRNSDYQLGFEDGENLGGSQPANTLPVVDLGSDAIPIQVYAGYRHTCALFDNDKLKCWGNNRQGTLGLGNPDDTIGNANLDREFTACSDNVFLLLAKEMQATEAECEFGGVALLSGSDENYNGILDGEALNEGEIESISPFFCAEEDLDLISEIELLAMADPTDEHCLGYSGYQWRLGFDSDGNGEFNSEMGDNLPYLASASSAPIVDVAMGYQHMCVLHQDGAFHCWGDASEGAIGLDSTQNWGDENAETSANVASPDLGQYRSVMAIAAGLEQTCALLDNNEVKCWGYSGYGETANPHFYDIAVGDGLDEEQQPVEEMGDNLPAVAWW